MLGPVPTAKQRKGLIQSIPAGESFGRVGIDLLGPFPKTTQGNKYVNTFIDYGTRWAETLAVPAGTARAQEVVKFLLENIICRHSTPGSILTYRGQVFSSAIVRELLRLMDIQGTMTSAYRPQCNGAVEHLYATLITMMPQYVSSKQKNWDQCLPLANFAYNIKKHESAGFSPFLLPILPSEICLNQNVGEEESKQLLRLVAQNLRKQQEKAKHRVSAWLRGADLHPNKREGSHTQIYAPLEWSSRGGEKDHTKFCIL
ncbi:hypothetical protein PR048_015416 [Dryococelus australis]|uniref:Integrase catalytic domain-containing protein n=1 Tax=Dryococelus australis TaxID=614101 RepID=A0ABQ9HGV4_9NEOP|nr:hypothetical protein PR048_015416 [Dryococelus australis]